MYQEEKEQITAITNKIANALNWKNVSEEDDWKGVISDGNSFLSISIISWGANKGRIVIRGDYNIFYQFLPYKKEKTEITVTPTKTPEQIAKDIKNRLLPTYQKQLKEAQGKKQAHDNFKDNEKATLESIASFMKAGKIEIKDNTIYSYKPIDIKINTSCDNTFNVEIRHITKENLKTILTSLYDKAEVSHE